jgi:hypothetical protein
MCKEKKNKPKDCVSICFLKHPPTFGFSSVVPNPMYPAKESENQKIGAGIKASSFQCIDLSMKNDICTIQ